MPHTANNSQKQSLYRGVDSDKLGQKQHGQLAALCLYSRFIGKSDSPLNARIAQLVEQRIENPCVPGSNPGSGTISFATNKRHRQGHRPTVRPELTTPSHPATSNPPLCVYVKRWRTD